MMSCSEKEKKQDLLPEPSIPGKWETKMCTKMYKYDGMNTLEDVYDPPFEEVQDPIVSIRFADNMMYVTIADSAERAGVRYIYQKDIRQIQIIDAAQKHHPFCFVDYLSYTHLNISFAEVQDTADASASSYQSCIMVRR